MRTPLMELRARVRQDRPVAIHRLPCPARCEETFNRSFRGYTAIQSRLAVRNE